jgi:hypothetical protein
MTTQFDYRRHEWNLILGAPSLTALILIQADPCSHRVAYQKVRAVVTAIEETTCQGSASALIRSVTSAVRAGQSPLWPTEYPRDLRDVRHWALDACQQVAALLAQKAPEAEADAYIHWLMRIGQRVAMIPDDDVIQLHDPDGRNARRRIALEELATALDARSVYDEFA